MLETSKQGQYAGFITRLAAFVIDILFINLIIYIVSQIAVLLVKFFGVERYLPETATDYFVMAVAVVVMGIGLSFSYLYAIFLWRISGQTLGKALMGVRVVGADGRFLTFRQGTIRFFAYWLSALALFTGFLWSLIDDRRQTWHDKLAKTYVIYAWEAEGSGQLVRQLKARRKKHGSTVE
jgi:uncharacterized RDD family membrane protein YckC